MTRPVSACPGDLSDGENTLVVRVRPVFPFEQKGPEIDVGDVDGRVAGGDGHGGRRVEGTVIGRGDVLWRFQKREDINT